MALKLDTKQWQQELVAAYRYGDEDQARALIAQLTPQPRKARAVLESMLADPEVLVRQAAAFGLGELGGATSARRLEKQLALEEARVDYDGASVVEAITQALGRIKDSSARASLVRRLNRLTEGKPGRAEVNEVAYALWRRRHPELVPAVQRALEQLSLPAPTALHGLLLLLEKSPGELRSWAGDLSVPMQHKAEVLMVLLEQIPDALLSTLDPFIATARALVATAASQRGADCYYFEDLLSLLLMYRERTLSALSQEARAELHDLARELVGSTCPACSLKSAAILEHVGHPEDADLLEAHRPTEPALAKVFDEAARALRERKR